MLQLPANTIIRYPENTAFRQTNLSKGAMCITIQGDPDRMGKREQDENMNKKALDSHW